MPEHETAKALGVNPDGLIKNIQVWLTGISFGLHAVDSAIDFNVVYQDRSNHTITVDTDIFFPTEWEWDKVWWWLQDQTGRTYWWHAKINKVTGQISLLIKWEPSLTRAM